MHCLLPALHNVSGKHQLPKGRSAWRSAGLLQARRKVCPTLAGHHAQMTSYRLGRMGKEQDRSPSFRSRKRELNTKLVSSIEATSSRLRTMAVNALLPEVARLLSNTQISLVVVCDQAGAMAGVFTKTDIVRQIGDFDGAACTRNAADVMTKDATFCRATDLLRAYSGHRRGGHANRCRQRARRTSRAVGRRPI